MNKGVRAWPALALVMAGCGWGGVDAPADEAPARFAAQCVLTMRVTDAAGQVMPSPIIEPSHVASIVADAPLVPGERAVTVNLTALGERRMQMHTRDKVGRAAVVYCGDREVFRARIVEPLGSSFRVTLPEQDPL